MLIPDTTVRALETVFRALAQRERHDVEQSAAELPKPAFLDDEDPTDALPPPYRTQSLPQILAALTDDELARWPGEMADQEQERRIAAK